MAWNEHLLNISTVCASSGHRTLLSTPIHLQQPLTPKWLVPRKRLYKPELWFLPLISRARQFHTGQNSLLARKRNSPFLLVTFLLLITAIPLPWPPGARSPPSLSKKSGQMRSCFPQAALQSKGSVLLVTEEAWVCKKEGGRRPADVVHLRYAPDQAFPSWATLGAPARSSCVSCECSGGPIVSTGNTDVSLWSNLSATNSTQTP